MSKGAGPTPSIKRLDDSVVGLIAAGEVIHRPANALKELLENSLDAGSTQVSIVVKNGGMKFLQIKDNGHGIKKEDMAIVCERFTTSKLTKFEDLKAIATYGFRGEALSSISHIAHLSIVTMTAKDTCAWRADYKDGKLLERNGKAEVTPTAGVKGTTITVEDMFYNVPSRKKALAKVHEEYVRIVDLVAKYAIHNAGIAITLKRKEETTSDVHTLKTYGTVDCIRAIYTQEVAKSLLAIDGTDQKLSCEIQGYISNPSYHKRKNDFILFINHRLVDCKPLKKSVHALYATLLPRGCHPFLYFSLQLNPKNVDVNIHPTKSEVRFLHQDEIIQKVCELVQAQLDSTNASRTFHTQSLSSSLPLPDDDDIQNSTTNNNNTTSTPGGAGRGKKTAPNKAVRTDHRTQTLDAFVDMSANTMGGTAQQQPSPKTKSAVIFRDPRQTTLTGEKRKRPDGNNPDLDDFDVPPAPTRNVRARNDNADAAGDAINNATPAPVARKPISRTPAKRTKPQLTSITHLLGDVTESCHNGLVRLFKNYSFVGCANENFALIQHQTDFYLCNVHTLSKQLIYQECLHQFAEFPFIKFSSPASVHTLCMLALDNPNSGWREEDGPKEEISQFITQHLMSRRDMLQEYFSMTIDEEGNLLTLPQILPNYKPEIGAMATFVLRLGTEVEWEEEQECFETLSRELSEFYCLQYEDDEEEAALSSSRMWTVEHVFFPALRQRFLPPRSAAEDGTIVRIASLDKLYKVFERC